jgi:type IV pilus assembly protein PilM
MAGDSIWKKEIGFRKKNTPAASQPPAPQPPAAVPAGDRPGSIWKRELRFRKPAELAAQVAPEAPEEAPKKFEPAPEWESPEPTALFEAPAAAAPVLPPAAEPEQFTEWSPEPEPVAQSHEWAADEEPRPELEAESYAVALPEEIDEAPAWEVHVADPGWDADEQAFDAGEPFETPVVSEDEAPAAPVEPMVEPAVVEPEGLVEAVAEPEPVVEPEVAAEPEPPAPVTSVPVVLPVAITGRMDVASEPAVAEPEPEPVEAETAEAEPEPEPAPAAPKPALLKRDVKLPSFRRRTAKAKTAAVAGTAAAHASKNLVGLRIGSSQVAAACVHNNGKAEVVQLARTRIPRGLVSSGEVRDIEGLTRELKSFFSQNKLPRKGVRLGIASNRIGVRVLEVPQLDDPKLFENSIRFHAQETLPIAVTDAILDYHVLGQGTGKGLEPTVRVLLVFAHRELVDRHVEACRRAGLKLDGVDFEAFALLRALAPPRPDDESPTEALVAVAVGNERTVFAVSDGRVCDFTRVLEWGSGTLDVAIARALNLTPSQAEPIKIALALDSDIAPGQLSPEQVETARAAILTELQTLSRELVSSLQFYQSRAESLDIGAILLSGGGAELTGFATELERLMGVPVRTGDPLGRVELSKKVPRPAEAGSLAIAIGLGIED